jgi:phosphoserine phosphatase
MSEQLTLGVAALVGELQAQGKRVFLVSGGFRQMIEPVAEAVGVRKEDVFANNLLFTDDGAFAGHDEAELTARAGGKAKVVVDLKASMTSRPSSW